MEVYQEEMRYRMTFSNTMILNSNLLTVFLSRTLFNESAKCSAHLLLIKSLTTLTHLVQKGALPHVIRKFDASYS